MYVQKTTVGQGACSEALWLLLRSLFEHAPKLFRSYSGRRRSKSPSEYLLGGDKGVFYKVIYVNKSHPIMEDEIFKEKSF